MLEVVFKTTSQGNKIHGGEKKMNYKIVSDSGVNLREIAGMENYSVVPLKIISKDREFVDDEQLDVQEMVTYLRETKEKCTYRVMEMIT